MGITIKQFLYLQDVIHENRKEIREQGWANFLKKDKGALTEPTKVQKLEASIKANNFGCQDEAVATMLTLIVGEKVRPRKEQDSKFTAEKDFVYGEALTYDDGAFSGPIGGLNYAINYGFHAHYNLTYGTMGERVHHKVMTPDERTLFTNWAEAGSKHEGFERKLLSRLDESLTGPVGRDIRAFLEEGTNE